MSQRLSRSLLELARAFGVQPSYTDASGRRIVTPADGLIGALRALGVDVEGPRDAELALRARRAELDRRIVEPVVVAWDGRLRDVEIRAVHGAKARVELDDGGRVDVGVSPSGERRLTGTARGRLPAGYHALVVESRSRRSTATVFSAPTRAPAVPPGSWALFAPLYGLRSVRARGIGSFTELRDLDRWAGERGARMLGTLPLLSAFLDEPFEPSPYSPASRLFWNEVFVDIDRVAKVDPGARPPSGSRRPADSRHGGDDLVDYRAAAAATRSALEALAERFFERRRPDAYRRFVAESPEVRDYARFRTEVDRRRVWWGAWPPAARDGRLRGAAEADPAGRYHLYVQWLAREQLAEVGLRAKAEGRGLFLDLPLGVNGASYDVWRHRSAFAIESSAGAPPDLFFSGGQDWGFPPLHPERIREDGYAYPRAAIANLLRYASALRIDHVMGLHRLFWIPRGVEPRHGAYVSYRAEEWYALLSIEAHRAGAAIVGEDLGTVPGYVRRAMRRHRFHTSSVLQFEAEPSGELRDPPPGSAASLGTHDLPSWAAFWSGQDIQMFGAMGLLDPRDAGWRTEQRERIREAIVEGLRARGLLAGRRPDAATVLEAALRFLGRSEAALAIVALEDLWLEERPQNVPGTGSERPNWRGRLRLSLDELAADERVNRLIDAIAAERAAVARRAEAA
ncbi:MAG TPA: 4-alpha-glucanotransferase [Actinomycetota bacterium]|nr:4-alpha-glucanotransferase [Actinomycetota bacterium]